MKAYRFAAIGAFLIVAFAAPLASQQQLPSVDAWSKMPPDSVITLFGPAGPANCCFFDDWHSFLADNEITYNRWDGYAYTDHSGFGLQNLWSGSNPSSTTAPYGIKLMVGACQFIFAEPVYAVGGTFFSTQDANAAIGVSTVYAYDQSGNLIGSTKSSSLTEINGPYESRSDVVGRPLVSSWAGIWSDTPIKTVEFTGIYTGDPDRICCIPNTTAFASFAFSRTPPVIDSDGDGVPDATDECPNSIVNPTVVIQGCDSAVPNPLFDTGCTLSDLIAQTASTATSHDEFVSEVSSITNELKRSRAISGSQKGSIQKCAAKYNIWTE